MFALVVDSNAILWRCRESFHVGSFLCCLPRVQPLHCMPTETRRLCWGKPRRTACLAAAHSPAQVMQPTATVINARTEHASINICAIRQTRCVSHHPWVRAQTVKESVARPAPPVSTEPARVAMPRRWTVTGCVARWRCLVRPTSAATSAARRRRTPQVNVVLMKIMTEPAISPWGVRISTETVSVTARTIA